MFNKLFILPSLARWVKTEGLHILCCSCILWFLIRKWLFQHFTLGWCETLTRDISGKCDDCIVCYRKCWNTLVKFTAHMSFVMTTNTFRSRRTRVSRTSCAYPFVLAHFIKIKSHATSWSFVCIWYGRQQTALEWEWPAIMPSTWRNLVQGYLEKLYVRQTSSQWRWCACLPVNHTTKIPTLLSTIRVM